MVQGAPPRLELDREIEVARTRLLAPRYRSEYPDLTGTVSGCHLKDLVSSFDRFGAQAHSTGSLHGSYGTGEYKGSPGL